MANKQFTSEKAWVDHFRKEAQALSRLARHGDISGAALKEAWETLSKRAIQSMPDDIVAITEAVH